MDYYNLEALVDMGQPYKPLDRQAVGTHADLEMARHHVIPNKDGLKSLWDKTLIWGGVQQSERFMEHLNEDLHRYTSMLRQNGGAIDPRDLDKAAELVCGIRDRTIAHSYQASDRHPGFDTFWQIYCWLPGNLFEGPKVRVDDPKSGFDSKAGPIVKDDRFKQLSAIDTYIGKGDVPSAWDELSKITCFTDPVAFDAEQWVWDDTAGGPRIGQ